MTVFDNPFYILGASMVDDRRRLRELYDEKSLLVGDSCEDAFRLLTSPVRRTAVELRWFPGLSQNRIAEVLSRLHKASCRGSALMGDLCRLDNPTAPVGELNQLLTLLPYLSAESMDTAVLEASRLLDAVRSDVLFHVINESRRAAGISTLQNQRDLDEAMTAYRDEVCRSFAQNASRLPEHDYDILITRIAQFGISPIVEMIIRDYELRTSGELDRLETEIDQKARTFDHIFVRDYRIHCTEELCAAVLQWSITMKPLQKYAGTIGSNQVTKERERYIINALQIYAKAIVPSWNSIELAGYEWERYAIYVLQKCVDELVYQKRFEEGGLILQLCRRLVSSTSGYEPYQLWVDEKSSVLERIERNKKQ